MLVGMRVGTVLPCVGALWVQVTWGAKRAKGRAGFGYLPQVGSCKSVHLTHHVQQLQELFVLIVKAVPEDNGINDVGDCLAQIRGRVNGCS